MPKETIHSPNEEKGRREKLRLSLQILPSGFSADYINCFQKLFTLLGVGGRSYILPTYQSYVEQKLLSYFSNGEDNMAEIFEVSAIYYSGLSDETIGGFNEGISEINTLVSGGADVSTIKAKSDTFMTEYLPNKIENNVPDNIQAILDRFKGET